MAEPLSATNPKTVLTNGGHFRFDRVRWHGVLSGKHSWSPPSTVWASLNQLLALGRPGSS